LETAIIEMKSGEWVDDLASCRLLMDKRKTEVQLLAEHREVEMLKKRFILNNASDKLVASKVNSKPRKSE
jgi:hypothetical protein